MHSLTALTELVTGSAWFLHAVDWAKGEVVFTRADRRSLSAEPFLDGRWNRRWAPHARASLAEIVEQPAPVPRPHVLWHTAFCCSTLIARCLDAPGKCLSLKEPQAISQLADAVRGGRLGEREAAAVWARLGVGFTPSEAVLIKPSNDANTLLLTGWSDGARNLFLHSSLRHFLLSVCRAGEARRSFVRNLTGYRVVGGSFPMDPIRFGLAVDLQVAALLWRVQMAEFDLAERRLGPERAFRLDCADFLADPAAVLTRLDEFLGLGLGRDHLQAVADGPLLTRDAKIPGQAFDPRQHGDLLAEVETANRAALEDAEAWSESVFQQVRGPWGPSPSHA